jgi:hypothetical protein
MNIILRNTFAVIFGLALGSGVNMGLVILGPYLIPPPAGVDVADMKSIAASIHLYGPEQFIFPFLAHALGTMVGALTAFLVAANYKHLLAYVIGIAFLLGGISVALMFPAPTWFELIDLALAYLPMAWLGCHLGNRITRIDDNFLP